MALKAGTWLAGRKTLSNPKLGAFIIKPIGRLGTAYLTLLPILAPDLYPPSTSIATVVTHMTSRADNMPIYACPCLNVRISPLSTSVSSEEGWKSVSVDESSIKIIYEQLALKSRSVESSQVLSCRLCGTTVYRLPDGVDSSPSPSTVTTPMTPSRGPDFQSFFQTHKETWIQICTTQKGTITGSKLDEAFNKVSPIFSVIIPNGDTISPSPTPPTSTLTLPASQTQQLLNWPELFPPIPFVPKDPLFTSLAREAKKTSSINRAAAEEEIRLFVEQKRNAVIETESVLKNQAQIIWKAWKESQDKGSVPQPMDPRTHTRRQSSAASTNIKSSGPTVIRSFNEEPSTSPRESRQPVYSSSFSPSTMTPRLNQPISALATSLRQSGMHMPRPPSPSSSSSLTSPLDVPESNDLEIGTPIASNRSKQPPKMAPLSPVSLTPPKAGSTQSRRPKTSALKRQSMEVKRDGSPDEVTTPSEVMSPVFGSFTGKRKAVTFSNDEPDVVTVTRQIKAERLQKIKEEHARGEEAMFDLDDHEDTKPPSPGTTSQDIDIGPSPAKKPRRVVKGFLEDDDDDDIVKLSFPVSPSKENSGTKKMEYTMARSLPNASVLASSSLGLKMAKNTSNPAASSLEVPYAAELLKMMAGQTPTHRSAWRTGSFDPRANGSDEGSSDGDSEHDPMEHDGKENIPSKEDMPVPSTSVQIPAMVHPVADEPDNNFEGAMSKSVDPGPALELMTDQRYYDAAEEEEDREGDRQAEDLMKKLIEGRGSLYAQRILSHQNRGVPASMWRSVA